MELSVAMTKISAERITGLKAVLSRTQHKGGFEWECSLYLEGKGEPPYLTGYGRTEKHAISAAIESNYQRTADIVRREQSFLCFVCGRIPSNGLQTDHIDPRARGGRNDRRWNLRAVDPECHRKITDNIIKDPQPHPKVLASIVRYGWKWGHNRWVPA